MCYLLVYGLSLILTQGKSISILGLERKMYQSLPVLNML